VQIETVSDDGMRSADEFDASMLDTTTLRWHISHVEPNALGVEARHMLEGRPD
jgi:hypothetical protein